MADEEIPENIDLSDIASQNAKILSQLAALRLRLDVTLLASEQINAKLSALLEIQKSAAPQREMTAADTIPAPPLIDDFHAGDDLFGETETWLAGITSPIGIEFGAASERRRSQKEARVGLKNGVLRISLPKKPEARKAEKKIIVQAG